jgi:CHAT domain-containing protein
VDHAAQGLPQHRSKIRLIALLAVLAVGATGALLYRLRPERAGDSGNIVRLANIVGGHRLTRARLSGGFAYAPCQIDSSADRLVRGLVCEGPQPTSWTSAARLGKFGGSMRTSRNDSVWSDAHTVGIWDLVWRRSDEAVADLREAVRREPSNARALNDLGVALTESAQLHDDPSALIDAFIAADSAVRLDGSLQEAQFTLAVLLEHLYLQTDAIEAWQRYLKMDSRSPWAREVRERLTNLEPRGDQKEGMRERLQRAAAASDSQAIRSIVAENPSGTRALVQDQLGAWGTAIVGGDTASGRARLDFARALAGPLRIATNDPFMVDAVGAISRAVAEGHNQQVQALAAGHVALKDGIDLVHVHDLAHANTQLLEARRRLVRGGSPMSSMASLYVTKIQFFKNEYDAALRGLRSIRDSTPAPYLVLRSNAAQAEGLIYDTRADYVHVVSAYDSAVAEGRTTRDQEIDVRVLSWLAPKTTILHGREAGWRVLYAALAAAPRYLGRAMSLHSVFSSAALATGTEAPRLSLRYSDEAIRIARKLPHSDVIATAFKLRAEQLVQMRQFGLARAAVDSAFAAAELVSGPTARATLLSDATLVKGLVELRASPAEAEDALRKVVAEYRTSDYGRGLTSAYLYLAQSRIAAGQLVGARAAFDSAMAVTERQRATVQDYDQRREFLDNVRATLDEIVAFRADRNDSIGAFEFFEHTRSRVLLEQLTERGGRSMIAPEGHDAVLQELQSRLRNGALIVSYAVLPREVLIWIIGRRRFTMHRVAVKSSELETLVTQLRRSILDPVGNASLEGPSERLYELLLAPVDDLEAAAGLVVIPDKWLHHVPFAALRDAKSRRFVVQDHEVSYAPSAALVLEYLARGSESGISDKASQVLAVGNPKFDAGAFRLPNLPASEREARGIAAAYQHGSALIDSSATDVALESRVPTIDVLHFAGHAVVTTDDPQMSHLVLASDGRSDGAVFASEIARWHLRRMKLVVLSGCNTSGGRISATEGASSLARAFFAAGVHGVVASLWAIRDEDTADFFTAFHKRLRNGEGAAQALRATQNEWITGDRARANSAPTWAAFQLFGS